MRHEVAIALIICGTLLALAPPASDHFTNRLIAQLMAEQPDVISFSLNSKPMSSNYRFGCWALGAAMVGIGIIGSFKSCGGNNYDGDSP
jgi:hypothetical protein